MDEDGSTESGRTRLARGTKPHALTGARKLAGAATTTPSPMVSHARSEAAVPPDCSVTAPTAPVIPGRTRSVRTRNPGLHGTVFAWLWIPGSRSNARAPE